MTSDASAPRRNALAGASAAARGWAWALLIAYTLALGVIALWPTHVDAPAAPLLEWLIERVPGLSYRRVEFAANVALFLPLGLLLTLIVRPSLRYLVLPAAIVVTVSIESWQSLGDGRTATLLDVVANTTGAALGILLAALFVRRRDDTPRR